MSLEALRSPGQRALELACQLGGPEVHFSVIKGFLKLPGILRLWVFNSTNVIVAPSANHIK